MRRNTSKVDPATGLPMGNAKLTEGDVREIRKQGAEMGTHKQLCKRLAAQYAVGMETIRRIWRGDTFMYVQDAPTQNEQVRIDKSLELLKMAQGTIQEVRRTALSEKAIVKDDRIVPSIADIFAREIEQTQEVGTDKLNEVAKEVLAGDALINELK